MNDLDKALLDQEATKKEMKEVLTFVGDRIMSAYQRHPAHAAAMICQLARMSGSFVPVIVEEESFREMHMELIESVTAGLQSGIGITGSNQRVEMKVIRL